MGRGKLINLKKPYLVLLLVIAILGISSFFFVKENRYNAAKGASMTVVEPTTHTRERDGTDIYTFEFVRLTPSNRSLLFYSYHQVVHVYMNNVMIYARTKTDSPFGHTTGAGWNQVDLPEKAGTVRIVVSSVYPGMKSANLVFYQGNGLSMGFGLIRDSFPAMVMCLIILVIGICLLCFWVFSGLHGKWPADVLYLGLLVLFMGIWSLGETQGVIYLLPNRVAASYTSYTCLMAIGFLFILFTHRFMHLHDKVPYCILMTYGMAEVIVCEVLQFLNIRDLKQTVIFTHILIVGSVAYMLFGICVNLHRHCYVRRTVVNSLGFVVLLVTMSMDMYTYYDNRVNANQAGKFGVLIYVILLGIETMRETRQNLDEEKHLQFYRDMAMKDMLTGCYNRNAYDEQIEHAADIRWSQIVTFDLNDLKLCNDTFGHQSGDKYICDSATIIRNVYGKYGKVYRIGGDEFCVVTHGLSMTRLYDLRARLEQAQREYNQRKPDVPVEIACGFAVYDETTDQTLEDIRLRADARMYEDKKELKAKSDRIRRIL